MDSLKLVLENSLIRMIQFQPGKSDVMHKHNDEYQISVQLYGEPNVQHGNETYKISEGTRLITSPGEYHRHFAEHESSRVLLVTLQQHFLEQVLSDKLQREVTSFEFEPLAEGSSDGFRKVVDKIIRNVLNKPLQVIDSQEYELELANLLFSLQPGSHFQAWRKAIPETNNATLKKVVEMIHDQFTEELSLDHLSQASGISKYYMIRLFRQRFGLSPGQYINQLRLERAQWLLTHTQQDITTIALEAGFGSLSSFNRQFKEKVGVSATDFRRMAMQ
ncbi:MAG: helix-turn-helix domain-containing protein [Tumebacillaceae bacterium]